MAYVWKSEILKHIFAYRKGNTLITIINYLNQSKMRTANQLHSEELNNILFDKYVKPNYPNGYFLNYPSFKQDDNYCYFSFSIGTPEMTKGMCRYFLIVTSPYLISEYFNSSNVIDADKADKTPEQVKDIFRNYLTHLLNNI